MPAPAAGTAASPTMPPASTSGTSAPNNIDDELKKPLPMFARYAGAWNEYNTRIAARHSLTQMWLTAVAALLTFSCAYSGDNLTLRLLAAATLVFVDIFHAGLLWMHDGMMGKLHHFMKRCERWQNFKTTAHDPLPGYHDDVIYAYLYLRRRQNLSFAIIGLGTACVVAWFLHVHFRDEECTLYYNHFQHIFLPLYFGLACVPSFLHFFAVRNRERDISEGSK
jgi:hypothetical protein